MMYLDDHLPPHFHAWKNGKDVQMEIATGRVMEGQLDRRSIRRIQQWAELNRDLLLEAWANCQANQTTMKS